MGDEFSPRAEESDLLKKFGLVKGVRDLGLGDATYLMVRIQERVHIGDSLSGIMPFVSEFGYDWRKHCTDKSYLKFLEDQPDISLYLDCIARLNELGSR